MAHIMVVDDEPNMRWVLQEALERAGYDVLSASSGEEALSALSRAKVDLLLLDLKMKGMDGLVTLRQIHARYPDTIILILTAYGTVAMAVEAMQGGASDFLRKPFDVEEVLFKIGRALERQSMQHEIARLRQMPTPLLPGADPAWRRAITLAHQSINQGFDLRLIGESGSGRASIARAAYAVSMRRTAPLIEVDLETITADQQPDLLLGNAEHSGFWGRAGQGVLLLRHIGALSQAGLAALEQCWVRSDAALVIMTGTLNDWSLLEQSKVAHQFLSVSIPPLREHLDDLELFVAEWLESHLISSTAMRLLHSYTWPGNLAELRGAIERARVLAGTGKIEDRHLPITLRAAGVAAASFQLPREGIVLEQVEQSLIRQALEYAGGNKSRAAELLGLTRHTLLYRIAKYKIEDS